jgi:hypothetical protein
MSLMAQTSKKHSDTITVIKKSTTSEVKYTKDHGVITKDSSSTQNTKTTTTNGGAISNKKSKSSNKSKPKTCEKKCTTK